MVYVMHICKNKNVLTNIKSTPPSLKYCRECAKKQGIDFDAQTLTSNLTEKELNHLEKKKEQARIMRERAKQKINFEVARWG